MNEDLIAIFAKTLKKIRLEHSLSQEELAHRANLDRTYISGIEREVRNPTIKSIQKIINAIDISEGQFITYLKDNISVD